MFAWEIDFLKDTLERDLRLLGFVNAVVLCKGDDGSSFFDYLLLGRSPSLYKDDCNYLIFS